MSISSKKWFTRMRADRRHPPLLDDALDLRTQQPVCSVCYADPLDPIHWPPVGWRENLRHLLGVLR